MDHSIKQEETIDLIEKDQETDLCIVCSSRVKVNCAENNFHLLSTNLNVIFLLRNLLQVPDSQLEENLREFGDPVEWIRLCEQCSRLTGQAEELHCKIVRIKEELRSVQQIILDKTKAPSPPPSLLSIDKKAAKWKRREIWRKTRAFICSHDYRAAIPINPFTKGDKLAQYLESQQDSNKHVIKIEVDHLNEDDAEWEPPPSPEADELEDDWDTVTTTTSRKQLVRKLSQKREKSKRAKGKVPKLHKCHVCPLTFQKQSKLHRHLFIRHRDDPATVKLVENGYQLFRCPEFRCNCTFAKQTSLDEHIKKEHNPNEELKPPKRFPCKFCEKNFSQKETATQHEHRHHLTEGHPKVFKCEVCDKEVSSPANLRAHKRKVHKIWKRGPHKIKTSGEDQRICHLCGKTIANSAALKIHLVTMHKEDPLARQLIEEGYQVWRCRVRGCSLKYMSKVGLDEHVKKMHGGGGGDKVVEELSHFCAFCGKGFYAEEALKRHEKLVHEDTERKFKCEICGFAMTTQSYLDGHIQRVHKPSKKNGGEVKGEKVVICSICGMQFWDKDKLEKHKIIHDKGAEQPHPCDICGRAYSTNESMWKHKRKIHKIYRRPDDSRIKR